MVETEYGLAGIAAGTTAIVHEWLHSSDITQDIPALDVFGVGESVGSVSVGLAVAVFAGVLINYYVYEMNE